MNEVQVTRSVSKPAGILRAIAATFGAEKCRALALYWTDDNYDRIQDVDAAIDAIATAYASFVRYGMDPVEHVRTRSPSSVERPYYARRHDYLDRVADMLETALRGEKAELPTSEDLPAYPPLESSKKG